ncbi:MAG: aromatic-ring-hydroxylating dioxygenase subunit beta [Rhizobiales bacterium]|nr:aromatic-ring-hydroxylating dioxygenase subunit beta [Hyphomicrobiales bacterium]
MRMFTMQDIPRADVEEFLFAEADLLDEWRLPEWLELFTDDATYSVPATDVPANASPDNSLFYVADDRFRLSERVKRLMKRTAHAEFPHSRTRHVVSNVRIRSRAEAELEVSSAFITFRTKDGVTDTYFGSNRYRLVQVDGNLRIRDKRCLLDSEGLRMQGRVSIIL